MTISSVREPVQGERSTNERSTHERSALGLSGNTELDAARVALTRFEFDSLLAVDDIELCRLANVVEEAARKLAAVQLLVAAEVAERSRPGLGYEGLSQTNGCVRVAPFLEQLLRISGPEAARRLHLGEAFRATLTFTGGAIEPRFPQLSKSVFAGEINIDAAAVIVRTLDGVRRVASVDELEIAENALTQHATTEPVEFVAKLARAVRDRLDPDGVLPREEETRARREFLLHRERNGVVPFSGGLDPVAAALLKSLFDEANAPAAQPRFLSDDDRLDGTLTTVDDDGTVSVAVRDLRTRGQRQHDVFVGTMIAGIRSLGQRAGEMRSTAEVIVHVQASDLESSTGLGYIDGIEEPVSIATVERIACDAAFRKIVLGNDGEVLAFGKARYPFSSAQRKAIVARDGEECLLCSAPATWAEGHHVEEYWTHGAIGTTDVGNGVFLCPMHHHFIHHSDWELAMINGIPYLRPPRHIDTSRTWRRLGKSRLSKLRLG